MNKKDRNCCPVCGRPRGAHDFSHGKCMEERAKTEGKELVFPGDPNFGRLTKDDKVKAKDNAAKKRYKFGKLPPWMFS